MRNHITIQAIINNIQAIARTDSNPMLIVTATKDYFGLRLRSCFWRQQQKRPPPLQHVPSPLRQTALDVARGSLLMHWKERKRSNLPQLTSEYIWEIVIEIFSELSFLMHQILNLFIFALVWFQSCRWDCRLGIDQKESPWSKCSIQQFLACRRFLTVSQRRAYFWLSLLSCLPNPIHSSRNRTSWSTLLCENYGDVHDHHYYHFKIDTILLDNQQL